MDYCDLLCSVKLSTDDNREDILCKTYTRELQVLEKKRHAGREGKCYKVTGYWKRYLTIIPRARVGYEMITRRVGYHLISNKREWNNCFIKNNQEILLALADLTLQEQEEDNLMVAISRAWYNGSCTMVAKPVKSPELHYTMITFSINLDNQRELSSQNDVISIIVLGIRDRTIKGIWDI